MKKLIMKYPTPSSISYFWNFGSLLGIMLLVQILSGLFLSFHYFSSIDLAFNSIIHIMNDVNFGWLIRFIHSNGASCFFIFLYLHIARGLFFNSFFSQKFTWGSGVLIYIMYMMTAFLGYVLPWGQMSFWGATVITNLISVIPYFGTVLVEWVWGGFSVSGPTLSRFFSLHFLIPIISVLLIMMHIFFLHKNGSSNPLGLMPNSDKIEFHPFFTYKDILGLLMASWLLFILSIHFPFMFMDSDNFMIANPLNTPEHIQPEWYFLFAYCILRSITSKVGGVVGLIFSIMILLILPFLSKGGKKGFFSKMINIIQSLSFAMLTWLGSLPVETPFTLMSVMTSAIYFASFLLLILFLSKNKKLWTLKS